MVQENAGRAGPESDCFCFSELCWSNKYYFKYGKKKLPGYIGVDTPEIICYDELMKIRRFLELLFLATLFGCVGLTPVQADDEEETQTEESSGKKKKKTTNQEITEE